MFSIRIHHGGKFRRYPGTMYVNGRVDIFDMIDIDLFTVVVLNMMVVQLDYTGETEPLFYKYLRPLTSLDEGLYALTYEKDVHCPTTLVKSFKLIEDYIEHGVTALDSYISPPCEPTKEPVCESVTPRSLPQHDSSTPCKDYVCESITPRCMPHCMLTPPTNKLVIAYTQLSDIQGVDTQDHVLLTIQPQFSDINLSFVSQQATPSQSFGVDDLDLNLNEPMDLNLSVSQIETQSELPMFEEPNIGRTQEPIMTEVRTQELIVEEMLNRIMVRVPAPSDGQFFYDDEGIDTAYESQYDVQSSEDACTNDDDDDEDDDFLVDEVNEIVKPDVNVHLFGISMYVTFDNIGVTNLVPYNILEGKDVDVINADSFDSDPGNGDKTSNYMRRRLAELSREMEGVINASSQWKYSFYNGQKFTIAKEVKDIVYLHSIESRRNLKLYKNDSVRIFDQVRVNLEILPKVVQDQLQRDLELQISMSKAFRAKAKAEREIRGDHRIYVCLGALKLGFRAYIRELLGLDGAFMKGPFPGQVLAAVGLNSNNEIYPLAYALVEAESRAKFDLLLNNIYEVFNGKIVRGIPYKHIVAACWNMALNDPATPPLKAWVGRPKKKRKRSKHEDEPFMKDGKLSKKGRTITCQSYKNIGHNKATCKGQGKDNKQNLQLVKMVGAVIGLSDADSAGGAGVCVGSQGSSHSRWTKRRVQTERISPQKRTPTQPTSQPYTNSQVPVSKTRNANGREMGDGIPT
ncbi:hypothetical protein Tco_0477348 [Tanacetum coccineum]